MRSIFLNIASAIVGGAIGAAIVAFAVVPGVAVEKEEYGRLQGYTRGKIDMALKIPEALGSDFSKTEKYTSFDGIKDIDVVVVERNGVKTLRVYPNQ